MSLEQLERYEPYNEQEARDRALLLRALREEADVFTRENDRMHMTGLGVGDERSA